MALHAPRDERALAEMERMLCRDLWFTLRLTVLGLPSRSRSRLGLLTAEVCCLAALVASAAIGVLTLSTPMAYAVLIIAIHARTVALDLRRHALPSRMDSAGDS